jgi:predicted DNA-binding ribbon-helix-helix protein
MGHSYLIDFENQQWSGLHQLASQANVPVASLIREAVDRYLNNDVPCGITMSGAIGSGCVMIIRAG